MTNTYESLASSMTEPLTMTGYLKQNFINKKANTPFERGSEEPWQQQSTVEIHDNKINRNLRGNSSN